MALLCTLYDSVNTGGYYETILHTCHWLTATTDGKIMINIISQKENISEVIEEQSALLGGDEIVIQVISQPEKPTEYTKPLGHYHAGT
jgi:hypothetical protein